MSKLFDRDTKNIRKHIANALQEELNNESTIAKFETVQNEDNRTVINRHINNLFRDVELEKKRGMCKICTYHYTWSN